MADIRVRDMTDEDEGFVGHCAQTRASAEVEACAQRRVAWLREKERAGVRAKVALRADRPVGFLYVVPIEISPWGPLGEDLLVIPCLFVSPGDEHHGAGHALVAAAEREAEVQERKGVVTMAHNHEAWFMPTRFFEDMGYEVAEQRGMEVILWKRRVPDAAPPRLLVPTYAYRPVPGRVVVDLFSNRFCLTSELEAERVRSVAAEFPDGVVLNDFDTTDPETFARCQIPRAIFVNGTRLTWGYEAPREGLREAILRARAAIERRAGPPAGRAPAEGPPRSVVDGAPVASEPQQPRG